MTMKKIFKMLFYSLCLCVMIGCDSPIQEVPQPKPETQPTKYEVNVDMGLDEYIALGFDTYLQVAFFEYNDQDEMVDTHTWDGVSDGQSRTFTANKRSTKVTVKFELTASYGEVTQELNLFLAQVFYLEPESTIRIDVDGHSRTSEWSPI